MYLVNRMDELENSNKVLTEELTQTKKAFLAKDRQCEEQLTKIAQLEGQLRAEVRSRSEQKDDLRRSLLKIVDAFNSDDQRDLEVRWNCAFAFIGEAIRCESVVREMVNQHNQTVLVYEDMKKRLATATGEISQFSDTVDSLTFELNQIRQERDDLKARSQRQTTRITQLESAADSALKAQDIIMEAAEVLRRYKP